MATWPGDRMLRAFVVGGAAAILLVLALHVAFQSLEAGNVHWFHLDKERNLPTWFSGALFFLFGSTAFAIFALESYRNTTREDRFQLPILWSAVGAVGWLMSLDEITILHENLLWREVRESTLAAGGMWMYLTQWQIVFAPAAAGVMVFLILFLVNRLRHSPGSTTVALAGIGCWCAALGVESVREAVKTAGREYYDLSVVVEEGLEMAGAFLLLLALVMYLRTLFLDLANRREHGFEASGRFFSRRSLAALGLFAIVGGGLATAAVLVAKRQAAIEAPLPRLQRVVQEEERSNELPPSPTPTPTATVDE